MLDSFSLIEITNMRVLDILGFPILALDPAILNVFENSLAKISTLNLYVDIFEFSKEHVTVSSRIVYLLILDVLTAGVALFNN